MTDVEDLAPLVADEPCVLVGLHACGSLSVLMLRAFVRFPRIVAVLSVPCCYSKRVTGSPQDPYFMQQPPPLRLAEASVSCASCSPALVVDPSSVFRCLFSLFCARRGVPEPAKMVSKKSFSFLELVRANVPEAEPEDVLAFEAEHLAEASRKVKCFWTLKNVLGHAIERLVLLDRLAWLREHAADVATSELFRLFDPMVSPRCACLYARRK